MEQTQIEKVTHVYWNRERDFSLTCYVDFQDFVVNRFPDLNIDVLTNGITFLSFI